MLIFVIWIHINLTSYVGYDITNHSLIFHITDAPIWTAARATSAAPAFFKQFGNYVDGGLKANNPSMSALTRIHQYYSDRGKKNYKISCVVSLGCGRFRKVTLPIDVRKATSRENFTVLRAVTLKAVSDLTKTVKNLLSTLIAEVNIHCTIGS